MKKPIYLDYNATTPHDPDVVAAMRPYLEEHFGNPSSSHFYGKRTREAVETARSQVASALGCLSEEIVFTGGGTESNNHAIRGIADALFSKGNHIITSQIEHPAVTAVCKFLERYGFETTYVPVDEFGLVDASDVEKAVTPKTILITIMHANNEVGTVQPIEEISQIARRKKIIFHTDAAQSVGKIPAHVGTLGVDLLSIAGHKLYAPKGIGALYIRHGVELTRFMHGAGQERGKRAGTENVLEIVGLGKACEIAAQELDANMKRMRETRDRLYDYLRTHMKELRLNGHPESRLPNTLNISFPGVEAHMLLSAIEDRVAASAGAACHSGEVRISSVLKAMNIPEEWARGALRLTTGRMTTFDEVNTAARIISDAINRCKLNGRTER
ncbi:MAG TPA: cysteine desulfurase family protein [Dissulfurispiraceae bacterium]|nr:cysteine desulfurase family protein [Dissulfurispiraceae bacterium]